MGHRTNDLASTSFAIELHSIIWVRYNKPLNESLHCLKKITLKDQSYIEYYQDRQIRKDKDNKVIVTYLKTTTGRVIFNFTVQKSLNIL